MDDEILIIIAISVVCVAAILVTCYYQRCMGDQTGGGADYYTPETSPNARPPPRWMATADQEAEEELLRNTARNEKVAQPVKGSWKTQYGTTDRASNPATDNVSSGNERWASKSSYDSRATNQQASDVVNEKLQVPKRMAKGAKNNKTKSKKKQESYYAPVREQKGYV